MSPRAFCTKVAVLEETKSCAIYAMASWPMAPQAWAERKYKDSAAANSMVGIMFRINTDKIAE